MRVPERRGDLLVSPVLALSILAGTGLAHSELHPTRVARGGGWLGNADACRSASRVARFLCDTPVSCLPERGLRPGWNP